MELYIWSKALYGVHTWILREAGQKYRESFETWYCQRMSEISLTKRVRNDDVLHTVKEGRNKGTSYTQYNGLRLNALVTHCVRSAL
jgi:hypothetical protein